MSRPDSPSEIHNSSWDSCQMRTKRGRRGVKQEASCYMIDLGLVKGFEEIDQDGAPVHTVDTEDEPISTVLIVVTVAAVIITVIGIGLPLLLLPMPITSIGQLFSQTSNKSFQHVNWAPKATIFKHEPTPLPKPFQSVNWIHEVAMIEMGLTTLSRVMLLGNHRCKNPACSVCLVFAIPTALLI